MNPRCAALEFVEDFDNEAGMATINFSIPDEVKQAFNAAFAGQNKSAIVAELMREAVEMRLDITDQAASYPTAASTTPK